MITCTVDDLYESAEVRGGLTARLYLEAVESERTPVVDPEGDTLPELPYSETVPSPDTLRELTPTWRPEAS